MTPKLFPAWHHINTSYFLLTTAIVAVSFTGCALWNDTLGYHESMIVTTRKFDGQIGNLLGDNHVVDVNSECRGFGRGPTDDGKYYVSFDLTPGGPTRPTNEFHLFFIFPPPTPGQILSTNTQAGIIDAWFFKTDANYSNGGFITRANQDMVRQPGGQKMVGQVNIKWNSDADFHIGVDLTSPVSHSTWLKGEFIGNTTTNFTHQSK